MNPKGPGQILMKFFLRKKRDNSSYSLRALARDLKIDPSFLNRIIKGKTSIPLERLNSFIDVLEMDALGEKELKQALLRDVAQSINYNFTFQDKKHNSEKASFTFNQFEEMPVDDTAESLFYPWYKLALLELSTLKDFVLDFQILGQKLQVHPIELETAWEYLKQHQLIKKNSQGRWQKSHKKIRFATKDSIANIRRFHKDILTKAVENMYRNTDKKSFQNRYITSATLTVNQEQIEKVRERLQEMILEVVELGTSGECDKLYAINFNFFPLTK